MGGFTFGALIGIAATDPDHQSSGMVDLTPTSYGEGALGYGLAFAIPVALIGLPIGAIAGHKDIYCINDQSQRQREPKYVKIEIESIVEDDDVHLIVRKFGSNIKIKRSSIKYIDKSGKNIYITIPVEIYEEKLK